MRDNSYGARSPHHGGLALAIVDLRAIL